MATMASADYTAMDSTNAWTSEPQPCSHPVALPLLPEVRRLACLAPRAVRLAALSGDGAYWRGVTLDDLRFE